MIKRRQLQNLLFVALRSENIVGLPTMATCWEKQLSLYHRRVHVRIVRMIADQRTTEGHQASRQSLHGPASDIFLLK
jgi:hypothetical protein